MKQIFYFLSRIKDRKIKLIEVLHFSVNGDNKDVSAHLPKTATPSVSLTALARGGGDLSNDAGGGGGAREGCPG